MSRIMKECVKGVLYTPDGREWPVRVENSDDSLTIFLNDYTGHGTQFGTRVDFYDEVMGIIQTECEVRIHENHDHPEVPEKWIGSCIINNVVKITQRHLDVRVDVDIHTTFESSTLGKFEGTIKNLSAGGLLLLTEKEIPENSVLGFSYAFRRLERPFIIRVMHCRRKTHEGSYYGCVFINLSERAEAAIRGYVFRKMRDDAHAEENRQLAELRKRNEEERKERMAAQLAAAEKQQKAGTMRDRQNASTGVSVGGIEKL